jgi:hypothetical protein
MERKLNTDFTHQGAHYSNIKHNQVARATRFSLTCRFRPPLTSSSHSNTAARCTPVRPWWRHQVVPQRNSVTAKRYIRNRLILPTSYLLAASHVSTIRQNVLWYCKVTQPADIIHSSILTETVKQSCSCSFTWHGIIGMCLLIFSLDVCIWPGFKTMINYEHTLRLGKRLALVAHNAVVEPADRLTILSKTVSHRV